MVMQKTIWKTDLQESENLKMRLEHLLFQKIIKIIKECKNFIIIEGDVLFIDVNYDGIFQLEFILAKLLY